MNKQSILGRPWTPYEDDILKAAVGIYGDNTEKWKTIALSIPGRTNKACRKRWLHSLSPSIKKSAWTTDEDQLLVSLFEKHPNKWSQIAREIPGRTDDACSKRYREALDPNLKKDEWTDEEHGLLLDALSRHGGPTNPKWGLIGQELHRSGLGCRNRWRLLERKRNAVVRKGTASQGQADENVLPQLLADVWPLFADNEPSTYWTTTWDPVDVGLPGLEPSQAEPGLTMMGVDGERLEESSRESVPMQTGLSGSHVGILQNSEISTAAEGMLSSLAPSAGAFPFSLSACILRPGREVLQPAMGTVEGAVASTVSSSSEHEPTRYSPESPVLAAVDCGPSQTDSFHFNDEYIQDCHLNNNDESGTVSNEESSAVEASADAQGAIGLVTNEATNLCSLGTLAHAASTLSPSPYTSPASRQVQQVDHDLVVPSRKRRRIATDSPANAGMRVISDLAGMQKAPPKLSSSLPVAGDPSILAYVCGHSACLPLGAASFSTSGELQSHFKDRHMDDAGASDETPFRCGLKGCNKGWKSINGLQYHLQISKFHYQRVYSHATLLKKQDTGNSDGNPSEVPTKVAKRTHKCSYPGCMKEYKQMSGLRYHLLHGHPRELPVQLDTVPPRIARQLGVESRTGARLGAVPL